MEARRRYLSPRVPASVASFSHAVDGTNAVSASSLHASKLPEQPDSACSVRTDASPVIALCFTGLMFLMLPCLCWFDCLFGS
jgi:hypothetical protein